MDNRNETRRSKSMREILFRGKRIDNGTWEYGNYHYGDLSQCHFINGFEVIPDTLGQFTGIVDENGDNIFEGDLIYTDLDRPFNIVEFKGGAFVFKCSDNEEEYYDHINPSSDLKDVYKYGAIIGNIYDNKELLEEK